MIITKKSGRHKWKYDKFGNKTCVICNSLIRKSSIRNSGKHKYLEGMGDGDREPVDFYPRCFPIVKIDYC